MSIKAVVFRCVIAAGVLGTVNRGLQAVEPSFPLQARKILFLGDSITHAGHYIEILETRLRMAGTTPLPEMINLGLPSETVSGLSEPDHPFPRPDVHERLDRALAKVQPDVVVACYGMNDGIYYPFSKERFDAYQKGVQRLVRKVRASGAQLILMTPPAFDPLPLRKQGKLRERGAKQFAWFAIYENYDQEVLSRYASWIMLQKQQVDMVIDLHTPVIQYVAAKRRQDPEFTMSPDGVHVNHEGHAVLADAISRSWGIKLVVPRQDVLTLVGRRQQVLHKSWVSHVGHKRPGVAAGLPVNEARAAAEKTEREIHQLLGQGK